MTKITQKNYEAIKIYRQKEKLFELKGKIQTLEIENAQQKELLKECIPYVEYHIIREKRVGFTPQSANVLAKISQVLGEE